MSQKMVKQKCTDVYLGLLILNEPQVLYLNDINFQEMNNQGMNEQEL